MVWLLAKPPQKKKAFSCLTTQRCAGIRTTALACAHASGASGGSDVRIHIYIRDCSSNLYVGMRVVDSTIGKGEKACGLWV